ncbi:hypothetical protein NC653_016808 [Populus alba x Populus x berolinensis]|uniref:Uncharacterized protein n=1 Tax=Populus alba x Populus x berolinensis TaxID=444605 RepID=A0AAD6QNT3_9ROSI|nr:hypothetical protein NC653_016808 [Populus alba x Populus x berolinensis]
MNFNEKKNTENAHFHILSDKGQEVVLERAEPEQDVCFLEFDQAVFGSTPSVLKYGIVDNGTVSQFFNGQRPSENG